MLLFFVIPRDYPMNRGGRLQAGHHFQRCQPLCYRPISASLQELALLLRLPPLQEVKYKSSSYCCIYFILFVSRARRGRPTCLPYIALFLQGEHTGSPLHYLLYEYHRQHLLLATHTARTAPALRVTYCCKCYRSFGVYFTKTFASRKCFTFGNV